MITEQASKAANKPAHSAISELAPANGYAADNRSRLERFLWRLYPQKAVEWPKQWRDDMDGLYIGTVVQLSFADRLRVLVSGRLRVTTTTVTEGKLGKHHTFSTASPEPPMWKSERHIGAAHSPRE